MRPPYLQLVLLLVVIMNSGAAHAGEWKRFLDEDGVKGYTRSVRGSALYEVRSTIIVPARIEVVGAVLRDVEGLKRPGSSCLEARLIERQDANHYTFYVAYDFPWPVSDRDAVIQVVNRYDLDKGRVIADLRAVSHPRLPRRKDRLRITDLRSQFVIEYISRERTGVVYTSRADPTGHIPTFLVNRGSKSSLKDNALDLRKAVKNPVYVRAAASSSDAALVERFTSDPRKLTRIIERRLGELISDPALVARLVADRRVLGELTGGSGRVGEILLHGWGSYESKAEAVRVLLRALLAGRVPAAKLDGFVADRRLIGRILYGKGGDKAVATLLAGGHRQQKGGG